VSRIKRTRCVAHQVELGNQLRQLRQLLPIGQVPVDGRPSVEGCQVCPGIDRLDIEG
jgi:hypothetical protein